jgi:hypothetical protein
MMRILHRRADKSYVTEYNGHPYHVTVDDPLYQEVDEAAQGLVLEPEPVLKMPPVMPPTRQELMTQLLQIQAQIEALP